MAGPLTAQGAVMDIPDEPDWARMRSETGARLRSAMAEHGVDALILLMNGYVVYATGASWPLLDAGLSHVERPVAVVLADDEHPHLFMPVRGGAPLEACGTPMQSRSPRARSPAASVLSEGGRLNPAET